MAVVGILGTSAMNSTLRAEPVVISLCPIGNPGNPPDPITVFRTPLERFLAIFWKGAVRPALGSVNYPYQIGTYDVTVAQYTAFLNATARKDQYKLYNGDMESMGNNIGGVRVFGIKRSGKKGSYYYAIIGNSGNYPVTHVSWLDAARFCNWLHNGQPTTGGEGPGTTETGAYSLNGDISQGLETRNPGAKWWIPSEDEWYKAAYYDPLLRGGTGGYWTFATRSGSPPGNIMGEGSNQANYQTGEGYCVTQKQYAVPNANYLTPVGAFSKSTGYYGAYDMNGDVAQWIESIVDFRGYDGTQRRGIRGGSWAGHEADLESKGGANYLPAQEISTIGFRVATP